MWGINVVDLNFVGIFTEESCNIITTKEALLKIRNEYQDNKRIVIVLDNAKYQRAYEVQDFAEMLNIELVFLPAYSPNLSLVERIRKFFKKHVLENQYYEKFDEFVSWITDFFSRFDEYRENVAKLIHSKFQIIKYA